MPKKKSEAVGLPRTGAKGTGRDKTRTDTPKPRKGGLGPSPLDRLAEEPKRAETPTESPPPAPVSPPKERPRKAKKVRATYILPPDLVESVRDAAVFLAGDPAYLNLAAIVENALRVELARLEKKYHGGEPFPRRGVDPRAGRPVGRSNA